MKKTFFLMCVFLFAAAGSVRGDGNVCVWTGGAGDGKWSSAANWTIPPVSGRGDALSFEGGAYETYNDIEELSIAGIRCTGTGKKTLSGERVTITGNAFLGERNNGNLDHYAFSNSCETVYNIAFYINPGKYSTGKDKTVRILLDPGSLRATFNGDIHIAPGKILYVGHAFAKNRDVKELREYVFNGRILAPEGGVQFSCWAQSPLTLNGAVDVKDITFDYQSSNINLPPFSGGLRVRSGKIEIWYIKDFTFTASDTFGAYLPVLGWHKTQYYEAQRTCYNLNGFSQTIDRLGTAADKEDNVGFNVGSRAPAVLTMKATDGVETYAIVMGAVSLVWDPVSPTYACTFKKRMSDMSGSIDVRAGAFRLEAGASFPNASSINLADNAVFELDGSAEGALGALQNLRLAAGARFTLKDGTPSPFSAAHTVVSLDASAQIDVPQGVSLSVRAVLVGGVPVAPGTYTSTGGDGSNKASFMTGAGKLVVADVSSNETYWSGTKDESWHDAANWSGGMPAATRKACILKAGTYAVNLTEETVAGDLEMEPLGGCATLNVGAPVTFDDATVSLRGNSVLSLASDGEMTLNTPVTASNTDPVLAIEAGARFVSQGRFVASNLYGRIYVGPESALQIAGGRFIAAPPRSTSHDNVLLVEGGTLAATNATVELGYDFNTDTAALGKGVTLATRAGAETYWHNTSLSLCQWFWGTIFGTGRTVFSGTTSMQVHRYVRGHFSPDTKGETCVVDMYDNAAINGFQELSVGHRTLGRTVLTLHDPGTKITAGAGLHVGCENGVGELVVLDGTVTGGNSYGLWIGTKTPENSVGMTSGSFPTGIVKVCGGQLTVRGIVSSTSRIHGGLCVGAGHNITYGENVTSRYTGFLEISGTGALTNNAGVCYVGAGYGYGRIAQSGGTFSNKCYPMVLGVAGGEGEYVLTAGRAHSATAVYVGGASTNDIGLSNYQNPIFWQAFNAKGRLAVSGGVFAVDQDLIVAARGSGTVALSGTGLITAQNVVLSNTVDQAGACVHAATLAASVDASGGTGQIVASGTFTIGDGARFEGDLSAYDGKKSTFRLVTADAIEGAFAPDNVTFTGPDGVFAKIRQTATTLEMVVNRGLVLTLK